MIQQHDVMLFYQIDYIHLDLLDIEEVNQQFDIFDDEQLNLMLYHYKNRQ
jgi:hypothetical protein